MNLLYSPYFYIFGTILGVILFLWGLLIEPYLLKISTYHIKDAKLQGLKIVFASDFHIAPNDVKRINNVVKTINEQKPDLIILGGDFFKGYSENKTMSAGEIAKLLKPLHAPLGIFSVLGNHDVAINEEDIANALNKIGISVLINENKAVKYRNNILYISGLADISTGKQNFSKTLANTSNPQILVTHSPDSFPQLNRKVSLVLAGHTHGGQIKFPFFGAILVPSAYGRKFAEGLVTKYGNRLIVSRGLGTSLLPIRFNCAPEIVVINFN